MTVTSVLNSVGLILGPIFATYFAFEINRREDGQNTSVMALLLNFGANAVKLIILAMIALMLGMDSDNEDAEKSLVFYWGQISLNTLLSVVLETYALRYVFFERNLMKYEPRKMTKIIAVACGWALGHFLSTQILRAVTS